LESDPAGILSGMDTPDSGFVAVHNHGHVHLEDSMGSDLHIVNNARVSFDQESDEFTPKERGLLNFLMRERHGSPWEAVVFRFDVKAPIFVVREWQRHRMGCLAGDTEVSFVDTTGSAPKSLRKTMTKLHTMWTEGERNGVATPPEKVAEIEGLLKLGVSNREVARRACVSHGVVGKVQRGRHSFVRDSKWRVRRMRVRVLNEDTNQFTIGHIADVIDSGVKQVFRVVTESGRTIEMTADHKVYTDRGWKRLGELARIDGTSVDLPTNAFLMANGTVAHQDPAWLKEQRERGLSVQQIADEAGVSYHTVRKWLKIHDLKFAADETCFKPGHTPWNAGYTGYSLPKGRLTEEGRAKLHAARSGSQSNFWRGGITGERAMIGAWTRQHAARVHDRFDFTCQACSARGTKLHAHHVMPVWFAPDRARDIDNLVSVCERCHREIHRSVEDELGFATAVANVELPPLRDRPRPRGRRLVAHADRIVSVTYVGVKQTYDLSIEGPWHNFVANGLVVHNSFNEQSARYSQVPDHYYVPEDDYVRQQHGKPGGYFFGQIEDPAIRAATIESIETTQRAAFDAYHQMLEQGVAKELARTVLPVGMFSRMKWTVNLRALFNFLQLRNHEHAQREIRDYAIAVEELAKQVVPVAFEVFEENGRVCP
jgi:thymidylate synthase (FAD)